MTLKSGAASVTEYRGDLFRTGANYGGRPTLTTVTPDSDVVDTVVIRALDSAKQADWDISTFVGEFHSTLELLKDTMIRVLNIGHFVAKRTRRQFKRWLRARNYGTKEDLWPISRREFLNKIRVNIFNRLWLEARYGWRPLVYDILAIIKSLAKKVRNPLSRKMATQTVDLGEEATTVVDGGTQEITCTKLRRGSQVYHAVVYYDDNTSHFGANPLVTAWELTRYSFVIDWFINIGSWIQAISPREGWTGLGVSVSITTDYVDTLTQSWAEGSLHTWNVNMSNLVEETRIEKYERFPYSGIPLPHINVNLNPFKVMDLIALVLTYSSGVARTLRL